MDGVFCDENKSCTIDFSAAPWATDRIHDVFHEAKLFVLSDVDFVAETENELLLVEYKNANLSNAAHPEAFRPLEDKRLNRVAMKYYNSLQFLQVMNHGIDKKKRYVYILECLNGDRVLRRKMIDSVDVFSIEEWNEAYPDFPLRLQ